MTTFEADSEKIMMDALALMQVIASLKLPKGTKLIGRSGGTEVYRKDGTSYLVRVIEPTNP